VQRYDLILKQTNVREGERRESQKLWGLEKCLRGGVLKALRNPSAIMIGDRGGPCHTIIEKLGKPKKRGMGSVDNFPAGSFQTNKISQQHNNEKI